MSKIRFLKLFSASFVIAVGFSTHADASTTKNDTRITFDFSTRQVQFYGIYAPDGNKRGGLEAEIVARRNGISHLNAKLASACGKDAAAAAALPSWQGTVKSQGSEIFSNGVLKISLVAPWREVFKDVAKKPTALKSSVGTPIALRMPRLGMANLKCGLVSLNVGGKTVSLNPLSSSSESGAKVVNLEIAGGALKPATAADTLLLESSNLFVAVSQDGASESTPARSTSTEGSNSATSDSAKPPQENIAAPTQNEPAQAN